MILDAIAVYPGAVDAVARDDLVASLLLVHGLHPHDVTTRVRTALDSVRPYLESHGGDVDLLDIHGSVVRLRDVRRDPRTWLTPNRILEVLATTSTN